MFLAPQKLFRNCPRGFNPAGLLLIVHIRRKAKESEDYQHVKMVAVHFDTSARSIHNSSWAGLTLSFARSIAVRFPTCLNISRNFVNVFILFFPLVLLSKRPHFILLRNLVNYRSSVSVY